MTSLRALSPTWCFDSVLVLGLTELSWVLLARSQRPVGQKQLYSFIASPNEVIMVKFRQMCLLLTPGHANCLLRQPHGLHNDCCWQTTLCMLMGTKVMTWICRLAPRRLISLLLSSLKIWQQVIKRNVILSEDVTQIWLQSLRFNFRQTKRVLLFRLLEKKKKKSV